MRIKYSLTKHIFLTTNPSNNIEKQQMKGRRKSSRMKTSLLCIPRHRANTAAAAKTNTTQCLSPISLLERFREAVFRFIMLTALSKATRHNDQNNAPRSCYYSPDQHQSDAVADCIEFIKKSASPDESRDSSASSSMDADDQAVVVCDGWFESSERCRYIFIESTQTCDRYSYSCVVYNLCLASLWKACPAVLGLCKWLSTQIVWKVWLILVFLSCISFINTK